MKAQKNKINITLVFAPFRISVAPPHGIAILSSFLREKGYNVRALDLNAELPDIYKFFKRMMCMPIDLEATILSLSYPFLISLFYNQEDKKNVLRELMINSTLFEKNNLENFIDWLFNNRLKISVERKIKVWVNRILDGEPDIVGFSTFCTNFPLTLLIAKELKKERRDLLTVLGGPHVFWYTDEILQHLPWIDVTVKGEGESAFLKIINEFKNNSFPRGQIISEPYLKDINDLPYPDFSDFDFRKYIYGAIPVSMSRGCIYNCNFCHEKRFWKTYRSKKSHTVVKEIETQLDKYDLDTFLFCDSLVNGNMTLIKQFCETIIAKDLDIYWCGNSSIKNMNIELLKKLRKAGCGSLLYGIESGSQRILDKMHKGTTLHEIEKTLEKTMRENIWPLTFWLVGFPGEQISDIKKTKAFIIKNKDNIGSAVFHRYILTKESPVFNTPQLFGVSYKGNPILDKMNPFLWSHDYTVEKGVSQQEALKQALECRKEINLGHGISMYFPLNRELHPLFYMEKTSGKLFKDRWYDSPNFNGI